MAGGDVHPLGTPHLPCVCTPPMPRAPYWVFGSWVQPTGWVFGSWVQPTGWVVVAATGTVVFVAVYPAVLALAVALALWVVRLTTTTSAAFVLAVVLGVSAVVVAMRRRGDESPARPGPALTHAAAAASGKVL